jgi:uncharacterized protein (DUF2237 family)
MMSTTTALNVLGEPLSTCSLNPLTGFLRDGDCRMPTGDAGRHGVCARMTEAFLAFTKQQGNDLSTPQPLYGFPGLNPGDRWCLCVDRWKEAEANGIAPTGGSCRYPCQRGKAHLHRTAETICVGGGRYRMKRGGCSEHRSVISRGAG